MPGLDDSTLRLTDWSDPVQFPSVPGLRMIRMLGKGGQGLVFEAVRDRPLQVVAVKVPRPGGDPAERATRLRQEADLLANLSSPNIIEVLEVKDGELEGAPVPCVVMRLVEESRTLTDYARQAGLNQRERVELVIKIAAAVQHIHERTRSLHRDLKPGNILVGRDGEPKLIDLGLAISGDQHERLRERGWVVGTPDYMAPEQFSGDAAYLTQRTDVYALGVILFELLTGRLPYDLSGLAKEQKGHVITNELPKRLEAECQLEFPELAKVVGVALRKESVHRSAEQRWDTPRMFAEQAERALAGRPVGPAPGEVASDGPRPAIPKSVTRWNRPGIKALTTATVAVASAIGGSVLVDALGERSGLIDRFERNLFRSVPPAARGRALSKVALVGFKSLEEVHSVETTLRSQGLDLPATITDKAVSWRPLYPSLLRRLDAGGAKAAVFDIVFDSANEADELFAKTAADVGFPVVVGLDLDTAIDPTATGANTTILKPPTQWGAVSASFDDEAAWIDDVVIERGTLFSHPTLPMRAVAALSYSQKGAVHRFSISADHRVVINADVPDPIATSVSRPIVPIPPLPVTRLTTIHDLSPGESGDTGLRNGDRVAELMLVMPEQSELDAVTHTFADVLGANAATLHEWFGGRAVFVGNLTPTAGDRFPHPDGRQIWGVYGHAVAYQSLATGEGVHMASPLVRTGLAIGLAALPVLLVLRGRAGSIRRMLLVLLLVGVVAAGVLAACFEIFRQTLWYLPPYTLMAALVISGILAAALGAMNRARTDQS